MQSVESVEEKRLEPQIKVLHMLFSSPIHSNIKSLEESTSASAGFHTDPPSILIELEFGVLVFVEVEVTRSPQRETPRERQNPTANRQPTCGTGLE